MAQTWRTVRVFISSTFRDMHAERDHLVRVVFPELKERCRQRHIQLIDVDLRWGVTEKQAEGGGALDICLDEIDSCRPFFLGLLGYRYGSTPPGQEHSITAQEIYHGVLHNYLPRQIVDLRPIVEGILEGRTLLKEQVSCLVRCYQWDANKSKYLLQEDAKPKDKEMLHSIFAGYSIYQRDRSFFFFRSQSLTEELRERSESKVEDYFETGEAARDKLDTLKQDITDAELPHFEYSDLETFGQMVLDTLWKRIDAEFPEERALEERDWLQEEAEFHELFMAERTRRFVGRSDLLSHMHAFVEKDSDPRTLVITGEPGCGKSALMARFTEEVGKDHPDWLILSHFVGASPSSTSLRSTLRRFCTHLNRALGVAEEVPEDYKELAQLFPELLEKASENRRVLLIIDAVNQFEKTDNPQSMTWLPQVLPENMRVVVSTLAGETLDALKTWRIQPRFEELTGLTEPEIEELVTKYLRELRKEFPSEEISKAFYEKIKTGHPLYILVALEELRVFPIYEQLGKRVAELPESVPELFDQVLERVESDFSQPLVRDFTSFIACGRQGMTGEELQTLLKAHAPVVDPASPPQKLPDMLLARLRRAFSAYLFERSGVIDFFHGQLKEAVGRRYLPEESEREQKHQVIASYFEQRWTEPYLRALDELPHQLTKAKDSEGVERVLCALHFIEAKCASGMTYDLIRDYNLALGALPETKEERQKELEHEARVKKYTEDLIAYARGEIPTLEIIPSLEPWSDEKIRKDTERIINNPNLLDRIQAFSQFVNSQSHALVKFASQPGFILQQAYNSACEGPVAIAAQRVIDRGVIHHLLLRFTASRPPYNPYPFLAKTLEGHKGSVQTISVTPDGRLAVSGSEDGELKVWDLHGGQCLKTIKGHKWSVSAVAVTADGRLTVSGSNDSTLKLWDLESGACLATLGHEDRVLSVAITPDGRLAVSGTRKTLQVWNLETGQCVQTHHDEVNTVDVTPDGRLAVSGRDNYVKLWDLWQGKCLNVIEARNWHFNSIRITPDGKMAVSCASTALHLWNLERGQCLQTLHGNGGMTSTVALTPDGRLAVSGAWKALQVWNLERGQCLQTLEGYRTAVAVTPDGRLAVSSRSSTRLGDQSSILQVLDLERGQLLQNPPEEQRSVTSVAITSDGSIAVVGSKEDSHLKVWNLETGQCVQTLKGHHTPIRAITVTDDGRLAVSVDDSGTPKVWDLRKGRCLQTLLTNPWVQVAATPDGKRVAHGSWDTLKLFDWDTNQCIQDIKQPGPVKTINLTPDGRLVVYGTSKALQVWNMETGQCLRTLTRYALGSWHDEVNTVLVTPDGRFVVSGSKDGVLKLWDLRSGDCLRTMSGHSDQVLSIALTPNGKLAVSHSSVTLKLWDMKSGSSILSCDLVENQPHCVSHITPYGNFIVGRDNHYSLFNIHGYTTDRCPVTAIRFWLLDELSGSGYWAKEFNAFCPWCGQHFAVPANILKLIMSFTKEFSLSPEQSPCLELPAEAWDEPRLLSECPLCHKPLGFNPFVVDNRGR